MTIRPAFFRIVMGFVALILWQSLHAGILIVSPHPDDDILTAAGVEYTALQRGNNVTVVYMTNGDKSGIDIGYRREIEAVNAQQLLGNTENNLIFLGYPDGYLQEIYDYYQGSNTQYVSPLGQSVTYANRGLGHIDYHTYKFGSPGKYNRANIVLDLQTILATYLPEQIFVTSSFDLHPDHSTTDVLLTLALNQVLAANPSYHPTVHETIVWSTQDAAWPSATDPTSYNTVIPGLDSTSLVWSDRESLDVPLPMQNPNLLTNLKYQTIQAHASQLAPLSSFLFRFVHKDEIFWPSNPRGGNQPPIVSAGVDQTVHEGDIVYLDGSASRDPEGATLTYRWTQTGGSPVSLNAANTAFPYFTAPSGLTANAQLTFSLVVSDGQLSSSADSVMVTTLANAQSVNIAPQATVTASSQTTSTGQLAIKAVDGVIDGYPGDYSHEWATNGQKSGAWLLLQWSSPQTVNRVVLYDRPNSSDQITSANLVFSDGSSVPVGALHNDGSALEITFTARNTTSLRLNITGVSATTLNVGLAEIQVFNLQ